MCWGGNNYGGAGFSLALILVLFILLVIVGYSCFTSSY
ncbi:YjcZ family sporulation protein [Priestia megaterium]